MYIPKYFEAPDKEKLYQLIGDYGFATMIGPSAKQTEITHLPIELKIDADGSERLLGHMAKPNPHWKQFDSQREAIVIFQGAHRYITPAWYESREAVPTWNYAVVHVHGAPGILDEKDKLALLQELVDHYEPQDGEDWSISQAQKTVDKMMQGIKAFEMPVSRMEGKFKLSQNRCKEDRDGVLAGLQTKADSAALHLATLMKQIYKT